MNNELSKDQIHSYAILRDCDLEVNLFDDLLSVPKTSVIYAAPCVMMNGLTGSALSGQTKNPPRSSPGGLSRVHHKPSPCMVAISAGSRAGFSEVFTRLPPAIIAIFSIAFAPVFSFQIRSALEPLGTK